MISPDIIDRRKKPFKDTLKEKGLKKIISFL